VEINSKQRKRVFNEDEKKEGVEDCGKYK